MESLLQPRLTEVVLSASVPRSWYNYNYIIDHIADSNLFLLFEGENWHYALGVNPCKDIRFVLPNWAYRTRYSDWVLSTDGDQFSGWEDPPRQLQCSQS